MASRFTSKQSASQTLPAYMRRRQNLPGPWLGGIVTYTFGPMSIAGGDSSRNIAHRAVGHAGVSPGSKTQSGTGTEVYGVGFGRLLAVSWYCRAVSGAGPLFSFASRGTAADGTNTIHTFNTDSSGVDLNAAPSGIAYVDDTASTYYLVRDDKSATSNDIAYTSPDWSASYTSGSLYLKTLLTGGGQTATDLSVTVWVMQASHVNVLPAND